MVSHQAPDKDLQAFGYSAVAEAFNGDIVVRSSGKDICPTYGGIGYEMRTCLVAYFVFAAHRVS